MSVPLGQPKEPEKSLQEGLESSGGSLRDLRQLIENWMKPFSLQKITSDKGFFVLVVAVGAAAVSLGIALLMPGAFVRAVLPFICGFLGAILLMVITVVSLAGNFARRHASIVVHSISTNLGNTCFLCFIWSLKLVALYSAGVLGPGSDHRRVVCGSCLTSVSPDSRSWR